MNFDRVAGIYDSLARIVFGCKWETIQTLAAPALNEKESILILGGGTGAVLEELMCESVMYVELSSKMLEKARRRSSKSNVTFYQADFLEWNADLQFDAVYCPFFLDCFDEKRLDQVVTKIKGMLTPEGELQVLDFQRGNWSQRMITQLMLYFFRMASALQAKKLLDISKFVQNSGFIKRDETTMISGWVFYARYNLN
ncbi:class I SAM-dependent methyltransferase [Marinoscillum sp.]|uniref:class I SAM-dependent methyltransferase n=1 Tax=Marinoscillum sp. TaxID=2024838 RepID=UPI003BAA6DDB